MKNFDCVFNVKQPTSVSCCSLARVVCVQSILLFQAWKNFFSVLKKTNIFVRCNFFCDGPLCIIVSSPAPSLPKYFFVADLPFFRGTAFRRNMAEEGGRLAIDTQRHPLLKKVKHYDPEFLGEECYSLTCYRRSAIKPDQFQRNNWLISWSLK